MLTDDQNFQREQALSSSKKNPRSRRSTSKRSFTFEGVHYNSVAKFSEAMKQNDSYYYSLITRGMTHQEAVTEMKKRFDSLKWSPKFRRDLNLKSYDDPNPDAPNPQKYELDILGATHSLSRPQVLRLIAGLEAMLSLKEEMERQQTILNEVLDA